MFNFGDGAVAGCSSGRRPATSCSMHGITDGSFSLQVRCLRRPAFGAERWLSVPRRRRPRRDEDGLDKVSLKNFVAAARGAVERSGASLADVGYLCGIHMKAPDAPALLEGSGWTSRAPRTYDDTGHMSGVDPLFALDRYRACGRADQGRARALARPPAPATPGRRLSTVGR